MQGFEVSTPGRCVFVDITRQVAQALQSTDVNDGVCTVFCPHTTAGLTINENADPDVTRDMLMGLDKIVSDSWPFQHAEGNSPAHLKASLMGSSVTVLVEAGRLALGTWQAIYLGEFDGPRHRKVWVQVTPS